MHKLPKIDTSWTLFLDRDGVLNIEKKNNYILSWKEFEWYKGTLDTLKICAQLFGRIIIVTNQRGIGKGLMSTQDLNNIHNNMKFEINANGGRIDKFYHADSLNDDDPIRKPNTGMGLQAQKDFPEINFSKSIMVGNNLSDMEFGKGLGMFTIYVHTTKKLRVIDSNIIDADFKNFTSIF